MTADNGNEDSDSIARPLPACKALNVCSDIGSSYFSSNNLLKTYLEDIDRYVIHGTAYMDDWIGMLHCHDRIGGQTFVTWKYILYASKFYKNSYFLEFPLSRRKWKSIEFLWWGAHCTHQSSKLCKCASLNIGIGIVSRCFKVLLSAVLFEWRQIFGNHIIGSTARTISTLHIYYTYIFALSDLFTE